MSSGFKENFQREGADNESEYDDAAFYYFTVAMLIIILVPATYNMIISPILYGDLQVNTKLKNCECKICKDRIKERGDLYKYSWLNGYFAAKLGTICLLWFICYKSFVIIKDIAPMKTFIPHEILGVDKDAPVAKVKKAYRKLSREKHPDKNPDDPNAVTEFITITKAYTVSNLFLCSNISFIDYD